MLSTKELELTYENKLVVMWGYSLVQYMNTKHHDINSILLLEKRLTRLRL